jgi:hypothetical protein
MSCPLSPIPSLVWALFANQGCKIVCDKTSVTVYHPNGHPILSRWRDLDGPQLWQFPLTMPPSLPVHLPPSAPLAGGLSAAIAADLPHPSQGFQATSAAEENIQVTFLQESTQFMAMAAHPSSTTYNLQTLDLPSIHTIVSFYHTCLGFPVKQMWLDTIKAGNCDTVAGLTYSNVARYSPNSDKQSWDILPNSTKLFNQPSPNVPPPCHLRHCPQLPLLLRICHPIKSSLKCIPSADSTQTTQATFLLECAWVTST